MEHDHTILWRRLDVEGHDSCRVSRREDGWLLEGAAVFLDDGAPAKLDYEVACDEVWRSRRGRVSGWAGNKRIDLLVERTGDIWFFNGRSVAEISGTNDLDLGFTPATNTNAIRRLNLSIGGRAETVAAWLDPSDWTVKPLAQSYERLASGIFDYRSPDHNYRENLHTDEFGFVRNYPGLWIAV